MGFPLELAVRYLGSKKRASISVGTAFAILGVALGVAALATIMSVTGGFHQQFRQKVLGVNAHVLVLKYSTNFREYRSIMEKVAAVRGVVGVAPFSINPMMLTHGNATATGVLVKGVDPWLSLGVASKHGDEWQGKYVGLKPVLDLPKYIIKGSLKELRKPDAKPALGKYGSTLPPPEIDLGPLPDGGAAELIDTAITRGERAARRGQGGSGATTSTTGAPDEGAPPLGTAPNPDTFLGGGTQPDAGADTSDPHELPEEDVLPDGFDPDPCANAELVKQMPGIVVGVSLAKTLGLEIGGCLMVTSPTIGFSFARGQIKPPVAKRFRVVAVFEAGFDQYDSKLVYTDLYEAQTFYDHGDTVTGVEMKVADISRASAIADEIGILLASGIYHTMDWKELNHGLFTALTIQQWGMSAVLALIIVVAAFTVVATLIMVVLDKRKEISVMKAMGATDGAILRIFLYQGGIIGFAGTAIGLLLGLLVCKGLLVYGFPLDPKVYFISRLPVLVRAQEFIITGVVAVAICLVATIVPSMYAARLRPADGFRNQ